ncbi:InlB B-repeat-containing protein [Bacillus horti]|uniref:Repeat protein (TIGR02543 family) n=1 Tax=Caldalkalibacillus horti TaxID=77523 RepID=A0ABT9VYZ6_9BACI|nr:InlB B-repeat-containing protein [Bacillus horti]MDQ0166197.1 putative repeat protein (TIGR02543 family) [Bacillus horti]
MSKNKRYIVSICLVFLLFFQWLPYTAASFTPIEPMISGSYNSIAYGSGKYVIVGNLADPHYSFDGHDWKPIEDNIRALYVTFINDQFIAVGSGNEIHTSEDGITWESSFVNLPPYYDGLLSIRSVVYGDAGYVAVGDNGHKYFSVDGESWSYTGQGIEVENRIHFYSVVFSEGQYITVGTEGAIHASTDGVNWIEREVLSSKILTRVSYLNNQFHVVGLGTYLTSPNGTDWYEQPLPTEVEFTVFYDIEYGSNQYIIVGANGTVITSQDGEDWNVEDSGVSYLFTDAIYVNDVFTLMSIPNPWDQPNTIIHYIPTPSNPTYTVTYDGNGNSGGSVPVDNGTYETGATVTVLGNSGSLVLEGHTFSGWNTQSDGSGTAYAAESTFPMGSEDVTLYAKWNLDTYTVEFHVDGGSAVVSQTVVHGGQAVEPSPAPSKAGHTFDGWYTSDDIEFDFSEEITGDITLYAKWNPDPVVYTVTFEVDGGSEVPSQTVAHGEPASEPNPAPAKAGHTFGGWYTSDDIEFDFSEEITEDTTLYAKWNLDPVMYTVTFEVYGGSEVPSQSVAHGEPAIEPNPAPAKEGHTFGGWYTSSDIEFDFNNEIIEDITLYAKWNPNPVTYTVEFDVDGGSEVTSQSVAHGEMATKPEDPTKENHTFGGWYTSSDIEFDFNNEIIEDIILYAKWNPNPVMYTVEFDVDGGSFVASQTVAHGETATKPVDPTKVNYTFDGWYTSGNIEFDFSNAITSNTILYAKWTPEQLSDNASLGELGFSGGELEPTFDPNVLEYTVHADEDVSHVVVTPVIAETGPTITVNGNRVDSGDAYPVQVDSGENKITIIVTAQNGRTRTYTITVMRGEQHPVPQTYTVTYHGNKNTAGSVPVDHIIYKEGDTVTILGNTGNLEREGYTFTGWNTQPDGNGLNYVAGDLFQIEGDIILYAKWKDSTSGGDGEGGETPGTNPNPGPSPEAPNPSPTPGTPSPTPPSTELITVPVEIGNVGSGSIVAQTPITRTQDSRGHVKDSIVLTPDHTKEVIQSMANAGQQVARIVIPDDKDIVSEVSLEMKKGAIQSLSDAGIHLEIYTDNARIIIPHTSLNQFGDDVYFRVVPVKEKVQQKEIEYRAKVEQIVREIAQNDHVHVVARPMTIETNLQSRPVTIILPLRDIELPTDEQELETFLADLVVYIEHSDGEKELAQGEIVEYKKGQLGIEIEVDKFSTFTILQMEGWGEYMDGLFHQAYIQGYTDGTFKPQHTVTRAEIAMMLARLLNEKGEQGVRSSYPDVSDTHWALGAIERMKQLGYMTGDNKENFNPSHSITRAEMAMIMARFKGLEARQINKELQANYSDVLESHWAAHSIKVATEAGIVRGYENGTYRPSEYVTRAEAVAMLNRLFDRTPLSNVTDSSFPDVSPTHWAFKEIEEAAKDHLHLEE